MSVGWTGQPPPHSAVLRPVLRDWRGQSQMWGPGQVKGRNVQDIAGLVRKARSQQLQITRAQLCAEMVRLHAEVWIYTDLPPALLFKKEKERQLAGWKPEAVSRMLPGNQRNPGHDGMWGEVWLHQATESWTQGVLQNKTMSQRCRGSLSSLLSPMVQIRFIRHNMNVYLSEKRTWYCL